MKRTLSLVVIAGLLAACGGGDDTADTAADDTVTDVTATTDDTAGDDTADDDAADDTAAGDTAADDVTTSTIDIVTQPETTGDDMDGDADGDADGDDGDRVVIDDLADMPGECRDAMVTYLQTIEPSVEGIDWGNATMTDMEAAGAEMEAATETFDEAVAGTVCGELEFGDDDEAGFEMALELARDVAPGVVPWLEFIENMASMNPEQGGESSADLPQDCDSAIAYIEDVIASTDSMMELPMNELADVSQVLNTVSSTCDMEDVNTFFDDNSAFFDG